ncbi:MAG: hypothetical protein R2795_08675 [Saprospiraceae bacterium]
MQALQVVGQLIVEGKPVEALEALLQWVRLNMPNVRSDVELQLARVNMALQSFNAGLVTVAEYQTQLQQINKGILYLLDECKKTLPLRPSLVSACLARLPRLHL